MDKYIREFVVEVRDLLDDVDTDLLSLEREPDSEETISKVFRALHTIKGDSAMLGLAKTESITHAGEDLLARVRDKQRVFDEDVASALLDVVDAVRRIVSEIESAHGEGEEDVEPLVKNLVRLQQDLTPEAEVPVVVEKKQTAKSILPESIRVSVNVLDRLMNLVGELVLSRNQFVPLAETIEDPQLSAVAQDLNLITSDLQDSVMQARMQPIGKAWKKLPRMVRELSTDHGKEVTIETLGAETEVDRTIIEAIQDPLTHLVRNAVDHGIEDPKTRRAANKPGEGTIFLRAYHEGGQVHIEIEDDGRGLERGQILAKAAERGLIERDEGSALEDREVWALVFEPGFSTAESVSRISGRGVGMDVVKTNIERIGGAVELSSQPGAGMKLELKIPLTLAIVPSVIVRCREERYAIPQIHVVELVWTRASQGQVIELVGEAPVFRLRGELLPLLDLEQRLFPDMEVPASRYEGDQRLLVLRVDGNRFGLIVEHFEDTREIVVKALGPELKRASHFMGATIMEDGRVAMILDVLGMAAEANVMDRIHTEIDAVTRTEEQPTLQCLLFEAGGDRIATPLREINRLEVFDGASLETVAGQMVIQYGSGLLPLFEVGEALGEAEDKLASVPDRISVLVHDCSGELVGLLIEEVVDVVDVPAPEIDPTTNRLFETLPINGRATRLIAFEEFLARTWSASNLTHVEGVRR